MLGCSKERLERVPGIKPRPVVHKRYNPLTLKLLVGCVWTKWTEEQKRRATPGRSLSCKQWSGELGFAVQTIDMYQQAMDTGKPFAIVILDLIIPGGMGVQNAAKGILQIDPDAKMIVSSGYADDPIIANYVDHGFWRDC